MTVRTHYFTLSYFRPYLLIRLVSSLAHDAKQLHGAREMIEVKRRGVFTIPTLHASSLHLVSLQFVSMTCSNRLDAPAMTTRVALL
jgi:hypothetical protein